MAKNPALDRLMGNIHKQNVMSLAARDEDEGADEETLKAARESEAANEPPPPETGEEPEPIAPAEPAEQPLPAPEAPPAEPPKEATATLEPDRVEVDRRADLRRQREARDAKAELARLRAEYERQQRELTALRNGAIQAPATAPKPEEQDPEPQVGARPDPNDQPLEYERWRTDMALHGAWQARQDTRALREEIGQFRTRNEEARTVQEFTNLLTVHEKSYGDINPDYKGAEAHLANLLTRRLRWQGVAENLIPVQIQGIKTQFLLNEIQKGQALGEANPADYAFDRLFDYAQAAEGYSPQAVTTNGAARPAATVTPAVRVADAARRNGAARSVSAMNPSAVEMGSQEKMTADRWMKMSERERSRWRKDHPGWIASDELLDDGMEEAINPILENMRAAGRRRG